MRASRLDELLISVGDRHFNGRYTFEKRLGKGRFSSVWRAFDNRDKEYVAIKVLRASDECSRNGKHEIEMLNCIKACESLQYCVEIKNSFIIVDEVGPHECIVVEYLPGGTLANILDNGALSMAKTKRIAKQLLRGLDDLHNKCEIIHTDLKPDNILSKVAEVISEEEAKKKGIEVKLVDFGNACLTYEHLTDHIGSPVYRPPEVVVGAYYTTAVDIWGAACIIFELLTGDPLFDPRECPDLTYSQEEDFLAQVIELLGTPPVTICSQGKSSSTYFDETGFLRNISKLTFWSLGDVLRDKYNELDDNQLEEIVDFLLPMLHMDPDERPTAEECLTHRWITGDNNLVPPSESMPLRSTFTPTTSLVSYGSAKYEDAFTFGNDEMRKFSRKLRARSSRDYLPLD